MNFLKLPTSVSPPPLRYHGWHPSHLLKTSVMGPSQTWSPTPLLRGPSKCPLPASDHKTMVGPPILPPSQSAITWGHLFYPWCSALLGPPSVFSKSSPPVSEAWTSPECCVHPFAVMTVTAIACPQRALSLASACRASHLSDWSPGLPKSPHSCHFLGLLIHHPAVHSTQQDLNPR